MFKKAYISSWFMISLDLGRIMECMTPELKITIEERIKGVKHTCIAFMDL